MINIKTQYNSRYIKYANKELKWLDHSTDDKKTYIYNMKHQYNKMIELGWDNQSVTYKFNSYGFRADEFNIYDNGIMFIGCSHTMGTGIPYNSTWANIVATKLGLMNWNIGQGGGSMDTCFRLGSYWIPKLKPKIIVLLIPEKTRIELITKKQNNTYEPIAIGTWSTNFLNSGSFYNKWIANDINAEQNNLKNKLAIKYIADKCNIKFISESYIEFFDNIEPKICDARDLIHKGISANHLWSDVILNKINSI